MSLYINDHIYINNVINISNFSYLILVDQCSVSTGLRSEGIRKRIKFWIERLIIKLGRELVFRVIRFHQYLNAASEADIPCHYPASLILGPYTKYSEIEDLLGGHLWREGQNGFFLWSVLILSPFPNQHSTQVYFSSCSWWTSAAFSCPVSVSIYPITHMLSLKNYHFLIICGLSGIVHQIST